MLPFITTEEHGYGIYTYAFRSAENTDIGGYDYFVGLVDTHAGEIGKPHGDGSGTGLIQISMLADSFLRSGLEHAVAAINCRDGYGISASAEYAVREIDTGGGDTAGLNGLSGLVTFARTRLGTPITTGVFGEMFEGIYRTRGTHHVPHGEFSVRTGGVLRSYGGGAFVQYRQRLAEALSHNDFAAWMPGLHLEVTARMGWGIKDFEEESDSDDDEARKFGKTGTLYYGASLGGGYVFDPAPKFAVDVYGHASWVRQGGRKVTDNIGQHIEFSAADSLRLLAGVRAAYAAGERVRPYVGLAVDAEMVSRGPRVRVEGYEADRTKFSGVSALLELGVGIRAGGKTFIDIKASGSVGRHKSIAGLFEWRYEF